MIKVVGKCTLCACEGVSVSNLHILRDIYDQAKVARLISRAYFSRLPNNMTRAE